MIEELIKDLIHDYEYLIGDDVTYCLCGDTIEDYGTTESTVYHGIMDCRTIHRILGKDGIKALATCNNIIGRCYYMTTITQGDITLFPSIPSVINSVGDAIRYLREEGYIITISM